MGRPSCFRRVGWGLDHGPDPLSVVRDLVDTVINTDSVNERQAAAAFSV
jgi:hypothetical protein